MEAPGAVHHVVARGNARQEIVKDDVDRVGFVSRLGLAIEKHHWSCLAYCLLDNHFHLVLQTPEPNLGLGMKWLKSAYAQDFNHRHDRRGHLFGGRFYSAMLESDAHLVAAIVYVSLNPVRAGVVEHPEEWRWSSYAATIGLQPIPPFLDAHAVLELVDRHPTVARELLKNAVDETAGRDPGAARKASGSDPWGLTPYERAAPWGQTRGV